jgi:hypothetical protein
MRWKELSRMHRFFRESLSIKAKDKPRFSVFIIYYAFSDVFQHSVYVLAVLTKDHVSAGQLDVLCRVTQTYPARSAFPSAELRNCPRSNLSFGTGRPSTPQLSAIYPILRRPVQRPVQCDTHLHRCVFSCLFWPQVQV